MKTFLQRLITAIILSALIGCVASRRDHSDPPPPAPYGGYDSGGSKAPPPAQNLSGFAPEYRRGYSEGCQSAKGREVKDNALFNASIDYRMGWQDGFDICVKR